jgi:hypothetical protein
MLQKVKEKLQFCDEDFAANGNGMA